MPCYEFVCTDCDKVYEVLTQYDETKKYKGVICPHCNSEKKTKILSKVSFNFTNPVGTDRWTSDSQGHDYRFNHNAPNLRAQREHAQQASHMGAEPHAPLSDEETNLDGIYDNETGIKLS